MASGADGIASQLSEISERLHNLQPALEVFGAWLVKTTDDSFRGEKEHDGSPFVELKAATIRARVERKIGKDSTYGASRAASSSALEMKIRHLRQEFEEKQRDKEYSSRRRMRSAEQIRKEYEKFEARIARLVLRGEMTTARKDNRREATRGRMLAPGGIKILTDTARARNSQHYVASPNKLVYSVVGYLGAHMAGTADIPKRNPTAFDRDGDSWKLGKRGTDKLREVINSYVKTGRARP